MVKTMFSKKEQAFLVKAVFEDEGFVEYRFDDKTNVVKGINRRSKEQVLVMTYEQLLKLAENLK